MASHISQPPKLDSLPDNMDNFRRMAHEFLSQQNKRDQEVGEQINHDVVRGIFEVLINLSFVLFILGLGCSIYSGVNTAKNLLEYLKSPGRSIFSAVLVLLALIIISIIKVYKTSKKMTPKLRKHYDFVIQLLRGGLYISIVIFFKPFVFTQPQDRIMLVAFWSILLAAILYVIRKAFKWFHFFVNDKDNYAPWDHMDINSPLLLIRFAKFSSFLQRFTQNDSKKPEKEHVIFEDNPHKNQIEHDTLK